MANQRALPPSLLLSFDSKLVARKAVFGLFFKATKCVVGQAIRVFPFVSLSSECFGLFSLTIKNDGQFTADCDSGEEYNGSVD